MPTPRRLILCCDGTWSNADNSRAATNVLRLARVIKTEASDGKPQIVWYHAGVGTGDPFDRALGGGFGIGLAPNVRAAYAFLANNYAEGDEIFLFGFSRGAFTARSLGGLIGAIGLLHRREMGRFMQAWDWARLPPTSRNLDDLNASFPLRTRVVPIRCIGVWDTVGALGIPHNRWTGHWHPCASSYRFYDTRLGSHVKYAFQALAIDEKREPFAPVPWNQQHAPEPEQDIRQVWFAGEHADIGGGFANHSTADIAFIWMAAQVLPLLELDTVALLAELDRRQEYGRGTLHDSCTGLFRLAGVQHRHVGPGAGQYVHETALARRSDDRYPTNPNFAAFAALPIWQRDAFEQSCAWLETAWPPAPPKPPGAPLTLCDRVIRCLEGS